MYYTMKEVLSVPLERRAAMVRHNEIQMENGLQEIRDDIQALLESIPGTEEHAARRAMDARIKAAARAATVEAFELVFGKRL